MVLFARALWIGALISGLLPCYAQTLSHAANPYLSAEAGILSGTVVDPSGAVIPEATIDIQRTRLPGEKRVYPVFRVLTDGAGRFSIPLTAASYSVDIARWGFAPVRIELSIAPSKKETRAVTLSLPRVPGLRPDHYLADDVPVPTTLVPLPDRIEPNRP